MQSLTTALNEVDTACASYVLARQTLEQTQQVHERDRRIAAYYGTRHAQGRESLKDYLEALATADNSALSVLSARYTLLTWENGIYKAMGGRYEPKQQGNTDSWSFCPPPASGSACAKRIHILIWFIPRWVRFWGQRTKIFIALRFRIREGRCMLHILLVEDDVDLATTIVEYLALENMHCDYARTGAHGLQLAGAPACGTAYDAIVLDLNLPLLDGLSLCARLRQEGDDTPVLMLTARGHIDDKLAGFAAGTDDYLIKPFEMRELVARLQALSQRRSGQARILRCGDLFMDVREHRVERQGRLIQLSPIGWRILHVLLRHSPEAVSRQKLLFDVWGDDPPDSDSLKVHLFHLRKSIDAPFDTNLLHTMPGHGVALREGTS